MANCTFCGQLIPFGTGKMYIKKDAKVLWFCSRRCEKNALKLKRVPRTQGWTEDARHAKRQRMAEAAHLKEGTSKEEAPAKKPKAPAKTKAAKAPKQEPAPAAEE